MCADEGPDGGHGGGGGALEGALGLAALVDQLVPGHGPGDIQQPDGSDGNASSTAVQPASEEKGGELHTGSDRTGAGQGLITQP